MCISAMKHLALLLLTGGTIEKERKEGELCPLLFQ